MDRIRLHRWLVDFKVVFEDNWAVTASVFVLVRYYQRHLTRLCYIALLCYWYYSSGIPYDVFNQIVVELFRGLRRSPGAETDLSGRHWTINIAELVLNAAICWCFDFVFPGHTWTLCALVLVLTLLVYENYLSQLWLQKQITRLAKLDKTAWRWGNFAVERACFSAVRHLDMPATRAIMKAWWWTCHEFVTRMTPEATNRLGDTYFILILIHWSHSKYLTHMLHYISLYRFWLRELGKFANPDPPRHEYTPLQNPEDIRVLVLYPRLGFRPICCSLVQGPHMRLLFYEAISYSWGSMDTYEEILVDGCRKKVTKSVYEILASYSSLLFPRLLWIDALCIDQSSSAEKSQQVPLMEKIYRNALFTTIFLGRSPVAEEQGSLGELPLPFRYDGIYSADKTTKDHFENSRLAVELLNEFHILDRAMRNTNLKIYEIYDTLRLSSSKGREWAALLKMLRHPVFERVWVVQEVALSPDVRVRYGDEVISWEILASGVEKLRDYWEFHLWLELTYGIQLRYIRHTSPHNVVRMHRFRETCKPLDWDDYSWLDGWDTGLSTLLAQSLFFKATDPRDLIYGLMSLCKDPVNVSYTDSVEEVYLHTAQELIERGAFHLLFHAAGVGNRLEGNSTLKNLPSWVIDFTNAPNYKALQRSGGRLSRRRAQVDNLRMPIIKQETDRILSFSGTYLDTVEEIGPGPFNTACQADQSTMEVMHQVRTNCAAFWKFVRDSSLTADPYPHANPDQPLREAFRRTLLIDQSATQLLDSFSEWEETLESFPSEPDANSAIKGKKTREALTAIELGSEAIRSSCGGRRLFISRKGYIGLCPPYTRRGDLIYLVPGIQFPLVLRTNIALGRYGAKKRYMLVGECYAHGMMATCGVPMGTEEELEII